MNGKVVESEVGLSLRAWIDLEQLWWADGVVQLDELMKRYEDKFGAKQPIASRVTILDLRLLDGRRMRTGVGADVVQFANEQECWWDADLQEIDFDLLLGKLNEGLEAQAEQHTRRTVRTAQTTPDA